MLSGQTTPVFECRLDFDLGYTPVKFRDSIKTNTAHGHVRGPLHLHLAGEGIIQVGVEVKSEQMILESFAEHEE